MNYDHLNLINDFWKEDIFPNLNQHFVISSFDEYLKRMASLPSCKWLREFEQVKILRLPSAVDPVKFTENYKPNCVTFCCPIKQEQGYQTMVYQMSPTLHAETSLIIWIENEKLHSYMSLLVCYNNDKEMLGFMDEIEELRRTGDTEKPRGGF